MIKLDMHAWASAEIRAAADCAQNIADSLRKLNTGMIFDYGCENLIKDITSNFSALSKFIDEDSQK